MATNDRVWSSSFKLSTGGLTVTAAPTVAQRPAPSAAELLESAHGLWRQGRSAEALEAARAAAKTDPTSAEAFGLQGGLAVELGLADEAIEALTKSSGLTEHGSEAWCHVASLLAATLAARGDWAAAEELAVEIASFEPSLPPTQQRLGAIYLRMKQIERSLPHLEAAVAGRPDRADFALDLATAYRYLDRLDDAEAGYEKVLRLNPRTTEAHRALAEVRTWTPATAHLPRLEAAWRDVSYPPMDRARLGFALFKEYDDLGMTEQAWPVLVAANDAVRQQIGPWSAEAEANWMAEVAAAFPRERFANMPSREPSGTRPVFIVGLPRSGTTLVERILAAHTQVTAMGELLCFSDALKKAVGFAENSWLIPASASAEVDLSAVAADYRRNTAMLSQGAAYAIDKLPHNTDYLGAIRLAFPEAVIIHLRRSPMDSLFSAYRRPFYGTYDWSFSLQDLATHHRNYRGLMQHWRTVLGDVGFIEVDYRELVNDSEVQIRRILAACDLPFEEACLDPRNARGSVATASAVQVRRPINREGLGTWWRYAEGLAPLQELLAGDDPRLVED
jgi:Flp pilus assembly protein TadD